MSWQKRDFKSSAIIRIIVKQKYCNIVQVSELLWVPGRLMGFFTKEEKSYD